MQLMWLLLWTVLTAQSLFANNVNSWQAPQPLVKRMLAYRDSMTPEANLGISVFSLKQNKFIYSNKHTDTFKPASTLKVLVTAAALDTFALDYYPQTKLILQGRLHGSTFYGRMKLVGGGDPNISARYFPHPLTVFHSWADTLKHNGIQKLVTEITTDESFITSPRKPSSWEPRFFDRWYGAEISALTYNDNCVQMIVSPASRPGDSIQIQFNPDVGIYTVQSTASTVNGRYNRLRWDLDPHKNIIRLSGTIGTNARHTYTSLPVRNPSAFFETAMLQAFSEKGLQVIKQPTTPDIFPYWGEFRFKTAPFLSLLDEINQRSQNLHAELLLRLLGHEYFGEASLENGLKAKKLFLSKIGLDTSHFTLLDGSGLSYGNQIRPKDIAELLRYMARHERASQYVNSLGEPGISGAQATRMKQLTATHKIRMKTGFINQVQGLAGYIFTSDNDTLAVALYLNDYKANDQDARNTMDTLWNMIHMQHNMEFEHLKQARILWNEGATLTSLPSRLDFFSKAFLEKPYLLGPMGEGWQGTIEQKPTFYVDHFDCQTYLEHVLTLAYAQNEDHLLPLMDTIRYKNAIIHYKTRNHFFVEDWLKNNQNIVQTISIPGDTLGTRITDKKWFFKLKNLTYPHNNPSTTLRYLPYDLALDLATNGTLHTTVAGQASEYNLPEGMYGVAYVGTFNKLWVTHVGFLQHKPGEAPVFRHASTHEMKVREDNWKDYLLRRKGKVIGIVLFAFKE
jgi:PBP4 family serine-type D-alanyl-D-alanine carboxypeptidase